MTINKRVSDHYKHGDLLTAIEAGLVKLGLSPDTVTIDDLAPVDEFHIGGRAASRHFLDQLEIRANTHILDIGCGLGGGARFTAQTYGARVTGIDLTREYVETGQALCSWIGIDDRVTLQQASALSTPFPDLSFDGAYMMHVGMNIEAKEELFAEIYRVLASGARVGIYDIMRIDQGDPTFPVPWAASSDTSWLVNVEAYKSALTAAGFVIASENSRHEFAVDFFRKVNEINKANNGPPPLGLHTLMQQSSSEKVGNMVAAISKNLIAPVELIATKA